MWGLAGKSLFVTLNEQIKKASKMINFSVELSVSCQQLTVLSQVSFIMSQSLFTINVIKQAHLV